MCDEHKRLELPEGFKLVYHHSRQSWSVVMINEAYESWGRPVNPPSIRTILALKDWIADHYEELEQLERLSHCNRPLMEYVIKDLRTGNV
jgi:hypothetical protein